VGAGGEETMSDCGEASFDLISAATYRHRRASKRGSALALGCGVCG